LLMFSPLIAAMISSFSFVSIIVSIADN
jgi:hypothetical protein